MTGRPAAFSAFALASTASVADSAMAEMRWEMRAAGMAGPFFACSSMAGCGIRRNLLYAVQRILRGAGRECDCERQGCTHRRVSTAGPERGRFDVDAVVA